ncbi:MAG: dihydrodipicolinate synthase [Gammaproteobacteria bacterium]
MPYRVIVWSPGHVGSCALAEVIKHPELELAGVLCYSPDKAGLDAGRLVGLPDTGIPATRDKEAIFALDADVVLHHASKAHGMHENDADILRLLESGKSVITTTSYTHLPAYDPEFAARVEDACRRSGARFFGTGENPGFMLERVVATLTGVCHRLDRVVLEEYADCARYPGAKMVFDVMSMGQPPAAVTPDRPIVQAVSKMYHQALHGAAQVLGIGLERIGFDIRTAVLDYDLDIACGRIRRGTVAAQRLVWSGWSGGAPRLVIEEIWSATKDIPEWGLGALARWTHDNYWRIRIEGLPSLDLEMDLWIPDHDEPGMTGAQPAQLLVAMTAVRAIGEVCRAPPGIVKAPVFAPFRPGQF